MAPQVPRRQAWAWLFEYLFVAVLFGAVALYFMHMVIMAALITLAGAAMRITSLWMVRSNKS